MLRTVLTRLLPLVLLASCSTPLSPYAQLDELDGLEEDDDRGPSSFDAGTSPRDAGTSDAGLRRDAGATARDAGALVRDAGRPGMDCTRVPSGGFASLITSDCASRPIYTCTGRGETSAQEGVNQRLAEIARKCGSPTSANIGISLNGPGCATQLYYDDRRVMGAISGCIQSLLESERYACSLRCALTGPAALSDLN